MVDNNEQEVRATHLCLHTCLCVDCVDKVHKETRHTYAGTFRQPPVSWASPRPPQFRIRSFTGIRSVGLDKVSPLLAPSCSLCRRPARCMSLSEAINLREPDLENYSLYLISLGYPMKYELSLVFDYLKI